jgi:di/tricarboxylate transporter
MSIQAVITLVILLATLLVMGSQRLRSDLTALLVLVILILTNVLSPEEAFSAFGQSVIIIIPSLYVVGAALYETGVATLIASRILGFSHRGERFVLLLFMAGAALLSTVISSLLVVAVFMPAVLRVARRARIAPAQLLLPLNMGAVMGDLLTLIGAISSVVINDQLANSGYEALSFFSVAPYGLVSLAIAILWYALLGRRLLPSRMPDEDERPTLDEVESTYELGERMYQVRVRAGSDLVSRRLDEARLGPDYRINVVAVQPEGGHLQPAESDWVLEQDDLLVVRGKRGDIQQAAALHHLQPKGTFPLDRFEKIEDQTLRLAEVIVPFRSRLIGQTVAESRFRERFGLNILAARRENKNLRDDMANVPLEAGDTLLVQGPMNRLREVGKGLDLILVTHLGPRRGDLVSRKVWTTLAILGAMIALVATGLLDLGTGSLAAALALIVSGAISVERAYKSIDASIILVIGGLLPLATALENSGLANFFASSIESLQAGPFLTLLLFYAIAALLTQVVSNTVTGVLLLPIGINLANGVGMSPHAFALALIFAVSASYITPLTHGSNLMIVEPGSYSMRDFVVNNGPIFLLQTAALMAMLSYFYL